MLFRSSATSLTFSVAVFAATGEAWNPLALEANTTRVFRADANTVLRDMMLTAQEVSEDFYMMFDRGWVMV